MLLRRSEQLDSWLLVAATAVFVLTAERYFQDRDLVPSGPPQDHRKGEANSPATHPARAAVQPCHGRRASHRGSSRASHDPLIKTRPAT